MSIQKPLILNPTLRAGYEWYSWCFDKVDETSETSGVFEENPRPISSAGGEEKPKKHSDLDPGKGSIGEFCDKDVPLIYCCRKLVDQFLLSPLKGKIFFLLTAP